MAVGWCLVVMEASGLRVGSDSIAANVNFGGRRGESRRALLGCAIVVGSLAVGLLPTAVAQAEPTESDRDFALTAGEGLQRPPIEWSTWVGFGGGIGKPSDDGGNRRSAADTFGRPHHHHSSDSLGLLRSSLGVEASLPLSVKGHLRLGAWAELRGGRAGERGFVGGELLFTAAPSRLTMLFYQGSGTLGLRVGRSADAQTIALAWGYLAPWKLEGACRTRFFDITTGVCEARPPRATRYMVGVRMVATVNRSLGRDHDGSVDRSVGERGWSATIGIETEPLGALRALLGLRSWY